MWPGGEKDVIMSDQSDQPERTAADKDLSGRLLGNFRLLRRLGRGAMAEVYLAEQTQLRRQVAVKVLKPELAEDRTYLKRFEQEAQAAAALVHANIVQIYEVGHVERLHYIAQEYVQGQDLREWIARNGPPGLAHALSVMRQVAAALAKAAEEGVVHRDVKPENIMLTPSGEVKVADFGLARIAREGEAIDLTRIGITMGTPLYMSPEQVEGKPLDHRSDLYSFGVTCYHMLSGSPPFRGETALGVAVQHLKKQAEPLESLRPDMPPALCRLIHKMLAKDPEQRCGSALEVLRELRRLHLEHFGDNWPEDLPGWETTGVDLASDSRRQLTKQLGGLMKAGSSSWHRRWMVLVVAACLGVAFVLGGVLAWSAKGSSLLAGAKEADPAVPKKESALRQYLFASRSGTAKAWEAVGDYYPNSTLVPRAQQELARVYLRKLEYDRALAVFEELASPAVESERLRAFGLAGMYVALTFRGNPDRDELAGILDKLDPIRDGLLADFQMGRLLSIAIEKNSSDLDEEIKREWEEFSRRLEESVDGGPSEEVFPGGG
jgi:tRNA A-37 threonylcarbamoyl transferase component Bud32